MNKRVVIGMSGGVDSSVAAYLLQQQGYEVIGLTLLLHNSGGFINLNDYPDAVDASKVAQALGIEHYIIDQSQMFKNKVISYFVDEYINGRTPNPCVFCNRNVKFSQLLGFADSLDASYIATGHYADVDFDESTGRYFLRRTESKKDQSYMLYNLTQEQLSRVLFPLSHYDKDSIRAIAAKLGLNTADKPDSQEICFIPDTINYADYIDSVIDVPISKGNFIDTEGNILGTHNGITRYTVGQRKGLGIAFGKPKFVLKILPETNEIVLGDSGMEYSTELIADNINLVSVASIDAPFFCSAKVRYAAKPAPCFVTPLEDGKISVKFDAPQRAVTPGQSVVMYNEDVVIGGGRILKTLD